MRTLTHICAGLTILMLMNPPASAQAAGEPDPAVSAAGPVMDAEGSVHHAEPVPARSAGCSGIAPDVVPPMVRTDHVRYPYYSYRRPWYTPGPASINIWYEPYPVYRNHTIVW